MTRRVLLVEIGTPAELPVVTPPAPRPPSQWVPNPRPSPGLPPPTGLAAVSVADAAVLTWTPSVAGGQTIIEAAPDNAGSPGIWREVGRTGADTYTLALPGGARWARVRAELNGRTSVATNAVLAEPIDVTGSISEFEQELRDISDLVDTVAAQAAADAAALNVRADDLRADIDATIAEVSTLADLTDDLGTEITRVETESVTRDTATVETISLLGAKNGAGTAFILDGNTLRVSPAETLAQWRTGIQGEFASQSSRIDNEVQARQDGDQALATTLATVQATANNAATKAELTSAQNALAAADQALSERQDLTIARLGAVEGVINPSFEQDDGWSLAPNAVMQESPNARSGARWLRFAAEPNGDRGCINEARVRVDEGQRVRVAVWARSITLGGVGPNAGSTLLLRVSGYDQHGDYVPGSVQTAAVKAADELTFDWEEITGEILAPAGVFTVTLQIRVNGLTSGAVLVDDASLDAESRAARALSQTLSSVSNTVSQQGDTLVAHAQRLDFQETEIEGKASTTYVQAVEGTANTAAGQASSNLTAINGLTATAAGHTASINEVREVAASSASGNAVANPGFEGVAGWELGGGAYIQGGDVRSGSQALHINPTGHANSTARAVAPSSRRVQAGGWFQYAGATRPDGWIRVMVRCYSANGSHLRDMQAVHITPASATVDYVLHSGVVTLAPDVALISLRVYTQSTHSAGLWTCDDVFLEPVSESLADVLARYSLAVTAGGDVAGMQLLAGGGTSAIRFLANSMDVVDPGGASGWSLVGGIATWRKGSHMVVIGPGFGANDEFMYWSGPIQSNLANCRRNNAIRYETVTGESFQRGGIIAGTRVHSGFNPGLAIPSVYTTPSLGTGGNPISVNASVGYFRQIRGSTIDTVFVPGSGSNTATLQLWRKVGSGAWQMVASQTFTGHMIINNDPETFSTAIWNITGAITYTDTAGGTQNRQYEARLVSRITQGVNTQNPAHGATPMDESQSVGIVTEEDP